MINLWFRSGSQANGFGSNVYEMIFASISKTEFKWLSVRIPTLMLILFVCFCFPFDADDLRDEDKVDLSHFELISVLGTGGK